MVHPGSSPAIAVTGVGAVSPLGWGRAALLEGLRRGASAIGPFDRFDPAGHRTRVAGQVPAPAGEARERWRTSWSDRFAVAAAAEAVAQADLGAPQLASGEVGLYVRTSTGGMLEAEEYFDELCRWHGGRSRVSRLASQQNNGPADAVARRLRLAGPVETISSACASAALAIGCALDSLRSGIIEVALAGGADSLCRLTYAGFNSLRAVDERPCRPFRAGREGLSLGEGAGFLVLEPLERARRRRARPLAILAGCGRSCDAHHMTAPHPEGEGAARAISAALADAGVAADEIAFINAHGTGTPHNDEAEWRALASVFGERASSIPVTSTKAFVGHLLGSCGALEAVATVLGLREEEVHPTPGGEELDPDLPVDLVVGATRRLPGAPAAISTSLGFGGSNAALVFRRIADEAS